MWLQNKSAVILHRQAAAPGPEEVAKMTPHDSVPRYQLGGAGDWQPWDLRHVIHGEGVLNPGGRPQPLVVVNGQGCTLITADGRRLLDGYAGLVLCQLGYDVTPVITAAAEAAEALPYGHLYAPQTHPWAARLARELAARAPGDLDQVFFTAGGAESVETAVKLSRLAHLAAGEPDRSQLIAFAGGYHGSTLGALALTGFPGRRAPYSPWLMPVHHAPQPDPLLVDPSGGLVPAARLLAPVQEIMDRAGPHTVAAVVVEPIQGVGGMVDPGDGFLQGLAQLCRRYGIHLILDEVMTGFGRTGRLFACQHADIVPDFMALSKGITAGTAPLGAVLMRRQLCERFPPEERFVHGITFGGQPAACAAALEVLARLESEELPAAARRHADRVRSWGNQLVSDVGCVQRVMGRGLMWGVQLQLPQHQEQPLGEGRLSALAAAMAMERDLIVGFSPERDVVQFTPPLVVSDHELTEMLERLRGALSDLERLAADEPEELVRRLRR